MNLETASIAVRACSGVDQLGALAAACAPSNGDDYRAFLEAKVCLSVERGSPLDDTDVNPILKPHQRAIVRWMVQGERRACFAAFGLGKTLIGIEAVRVAAARAQRPGCIVHPLGVRQEFMRDAEMVNVPVKFIRESRQIEHGDVLYLTNYESVREGKIDPQLFGAVDLDEAAILRGFGGTKTFREFMATMAGDDRRDVSNRIRSDGSRFRFVATACPSPNEYIELLAYAAFLDVMDVGQAKTRFFKRNSEKADKLTLHPHKEAEFWLWVASWALFVQKPSDIDPSFSDKGYDLPSLDVRWHEVPTNHAAAGAEKDGQNRLFRSASIGVQDAAREKRDSLDARVAKMLELRREDPDAHRLLWHDLEDERRAIEAAIPSAATVYGSQDLEDREARVIEFSDGKIQELAGKPVMLGSGCNFQRHCSWAIFLGIGFKFADFIQAIHRLYRFLQTRQVRIDLIYTEAEREVRKSLERKWEQHNIMVGKMTQIIREYGLAHAASAAVLARSIGVQRVKVSGKAYSIINNDCVEELRTHADNSVDLILTSIPFATQYEYSPSYNDFGHTDTNAHFWRQMDFLTPNLLRVLRPGRVAAIHVKDRICPGGVSGFGFQTVQPFSDECVAHFQKHGFAFLARKTIVTDVVRENNQTYRLGWTEQCKDGSRMGAGMPEYLLVFRKPPTDRSNGYADVPVVKAKKELAGNVLTDADGFVESIDNPQWINPDGYSRAHWQFDAHGFMRSSGNRQLTPEELEGLPQDAIFQLFKKHSLENVYNFRHDVRIAESVDATGWLPSTFMLLQPQSWHPDVWTDITRMRTLNSSQAQRGAEMHLCPLQFDIVDRCIEQYTMKGETVLDPFAGLGTVPYCAVKLERRGIGVELNGRYFLDAATYCKGAEEGQSMPDFFTALELEAAA